MANISKRKIAFISAAVAVMLALGAASAFAYEEPSEEASDDSEVFETTSTFTASEPDSVTVEVGEGETAYFYKSDDEPGTIIRFGAMEDYMNKWDGLTNAQKEEVYGLNDEKIDVEKQIADKLAEFGLIESDAANGMKDILDAQKSAVRENGNAVCAPFAPFAGRGGFGEFGNREVRHYFDGNLDEESFSEFRTHSYEFNEEDVAKMMEKYGDDFDFGQFGFKGEPKGAIMFKSVIEVDENGEVVETIEAPEIINA